MPINVRIVQLGKGVFDYAAEAGATVAMGLAAAEVATSGMEVRVNGTAATPERPLRDGDLVTVIPRIKGGSRAVRDRLRDRLRGRTVLTEELYISRVFL